MTPEVKNRIAQIRRGEVPEGYKRGKIGIFPLDWEETQLKKLFVRQNRRNAINNTNVLTISAQYGLISQEKFFNKDIASEDKSNYYLLERGDFAYNKSYSNGYPFGAIKSLKKYEKGIVSPLYICFTPSEKNKCPDYYEHYFESGLLNHEIQAIAQEGARNHGLLNIAVGDFFNSLIVAPPAAEQQKIASILSTQDKIIDLKERLLEEKKQQKKYLMQQLLTGKKRLPGFSEEWENFGFNDVFCTLPTNTLSREDMCKSGGIIRNIHYGDVLIHYGEVLNINEEDVPYIIEGKEPAHYMQVENGDVIIADTAEDMTVGKTTEIQNIKTDKVVSGLHTICCRPIKKYFCEGWLGYYMNSEEYHGQIKRLACGSKVFSISKTEIKKTRLRIPCINEQKEIIDILSTKNREIALSEQSIKAEKQKKKALMQLLLTGIVRVKI